MPPEGIQEEDKVPYVDDKIGAKTDDVAKSALKESIKKKGGNSYYYAHNYDGQNFDNATAKKFYGDGIIHGGEPVLVEKRDTTKT